MCVGIPMRVVEARGDDALCETRHGASHVIDMRLIGAQPVGTWLLTFMDAARSAMTAEEAAQVGDALEAVALALRGENVDHLFADLLGREPKLPDFATREA